MKYFTLLEKLEANARKKLAESMFQRANVTVSWEDLPDRKVVAKFFMEYDEAGKTPYLVRCLNNVTNVERSFVFAKLDYGPLPC